MITSMYAQVREEEQVISYSVYCSQQDVSKFGERSGSNCCYLAAVVGNSSRKSHCMFFAFVCCFQRPFCRFFHKMTFYIGAYDHSVLYAIAQLTEGALPGINPRAAASKKKQKRAIKGCFPLFLGWVRLRFREEIASGWSCWLRKFHGVPCLAST